MAKKLTANDEMLSEYANHPNFKVEDSVDLQQNGRGLDNANISTEVCLAMQQSSFAPET